ncbi:glycosyltransferase family 4 protein [Erythrobacter sp. THAF29]|uniref:glycosyltransferase family 4 protein n=1 Tax=Erythrobacter sp. THAF29 TaxID=2587851 RepID=UPI0012694777|nr:glycosyltransferase family 4 protein [Erythrobacter sp. THAF29]QFT77288.1 GDP-mannose-dependent alpha-(1-6)-phosphatidylinositol monomannoside mannosyltransferase [Erythrobacter sp. THAF29]
MSEKPRVLHCHSTFAAGGKEVRTAKLINAFGKKLSHHIVSAMPEEMGARALIDRQRSEVGYPADFPSLTGKPTPGRLVEIAQALKPYDLILTYNWGAMDVVLAHTVFARQFDLPPLIHHEDGFNADEADQLKWTRNWFRRVALGRTHSLVVPSQTLEKIAVDVWKQPRERLVRIPNGIDTKAFAKRPDPGKLRLVKREGERWVGTLAGLRGVKQLPLLVEAVSRLPENWHLVILGDGPEKDAIRQAAVDHDIAHRVHLPGAIEDPSKVVGLFDVFALSSKSEQFPLSVVEAMAAGLPIAAPEVGDVKDMVSEANRPFICIPNDAGALGAMLAELAGDDERRKDIGAANREKARAQFDISNMVERYGELYSAALRDKWTGPR